MTIDCFIDSCVNKIMSSKRNPLPVAEVPEDLRGEELFAEWYDWKILKKDRTKEIQDLQNRIPIKIPPSYFSLLSRYMFPGLDMNSIFLYGNTGQKLNCDIDIRLFSDKVMSPFLFNNNFLQIGNPEQYADYDPICFDMSQCETGSKEPPIVQLDHEEILCNSKIRIYKTIAPSFISMLSNVLNIKKA